MKKLVGSALAIVLSATTVALGVSPAAAAPNVTSFSPDGTSITGEAQLTVDGTGFDAASQVQLVKFMPPLNTSVIRTINGTGEVVTDGGTKIVARMPTIGEDPGSYSVRVVNGDGTTDTQAGFMIFAEPPTLDGVNPTQGNRGQTVVVTASGTNLVKTSVFDFRHPMATPLNDIAVTKVEWVSTSEVRVTGAISSQAPLGLWVLAVDTSDADDTDTDQGGTATCDPDGCFAVAAAVPSPPVVTEISPSSALNSPSNGAVSVEITGSGFPATSDAAAFLTGYCPTSEPNCPLAGHVIPVTEVVVTEGAVEDVLTGKVDLRGRAPGRYTVNVQNTSNGGIGKLESAFGLVATGAPVVTSPSSGARATIPADVDTEVEVAGDHFAQGAVVSTDNEDIDVSNVSVTSKTALTATFTPAAGTENGRYDLIVANTDGQTTTCENCLEVTGGTDAGTSYTPTTPRRLLDTRTSGGGGKLGAGATRTLPVAGLGEVPEEVEAVVLNVTVTSPTAGGWVTVHPCGARPTASNLNYGAGQTVANLVFATVSAGGDVCVYTSASTHLVVDLQGYFPQVADYNPQTPQRLADTRSASKIPAGGTAQLQVGGVAGVSTTASAAVLNVTVTQPEGSGWVTVYPCAEGRPTTSNLNFAAGRTVANLTVLKLDSAGKVCFYATAKTHVIVDLNGWFPEDSELEPVKSRRVLDTRQTGRLAARSTLKLDVDTIAEVPDGASAIVANVTVTQPGASGYITAYPCDQPRPLSSNLNFLQGQTVPNLLVVRPSAAGRICLYTSEATHLLVDYGGSFVPGS